MPKRSDINSILIIGAGPITIGQACEFDYSGVQAVKALKDEGYRVILVNSNPATIMTDPELADATYIEPVNPHFLKIILNIEKPDAILPTMGGQTALNCALSLDKSGYLQQHGIKLIGANARSIEMAEDRKLFVEAMNRIQLESPRSAIVSSPEIRDSQNLLTGYDHAHGLILALQTLEKTGLPAIIRPAFTLGGAGGGVAYNRSEFETLARKGLETSPKAQILIDESLIGWKEFELEVVRDTADNTIIVCSIENIDPMGVHTGDSITVAPALTLTDREYQKMRDAAFSVIREIGVETGGANVQFAINPKTGQQIVIEMNPRVSRSSALASKATGFPIAKIAAKLAVGYTLDELDNDITRTTPASFEPVLDYVVTKIPRFAFEKYHGAETVLTTSMKSVGEAMAIGRSFPESLQKALRSLETGLTGLDETTLANDPIDTMLEELAKPSPDRLRLIADLIRAGSSLEQIYATCQIDPWFLQQIADLVQQEQTLQQHGLPKSVPEWRNLKAQGFSDARIAKLGGMKETEIRQKRQSLGVRPVFRKIDTCAGEFAASTPYFYSSHERGPASSDDTETTAMCEAQPENTPKAVIIGGGPNRIGQGLEFDYCCCHAAFAMTEMKWQSIMINCNPETVSTDYDTSDRLYFEPLTQEDVLEILHCEQSNGNLRGVIVQFGGQTPLKLAPALHQAGIPILGTSTDSLDQAENRGRFAKLLDQIGLLQAPSRITYNADDAANAAQELGFPVMLRPSNVLGGRAMQIACDNEELRLFADDALNAAEGSGLLIDRFLSDATEIDVDALCDGKNVHVAGIMEHIEEAGIHSGDSACSLPPHSLTPDIIQEITSQTCSIAKALQVKGLLNVQFAIRNKKIFVLEANPRASRTIPFVSKAAGYPFARIATQIMAGKNLASFKLNHRPAPRQTVKEAVFPFSRFPGTDPSLGPEMRSTGEVMGIGKNFGTAFLKSQIASGTTLPKTGACFISVRDQDKTGATEIARNLIALGFSLIATDGTCKHLRNHGLQVQHVNKVRQGRPHIVDRLGDGHIQLVINTTQGARSLTDSASIRQTALHANVPYFTTLGGGRAALAAITALLNLSPDTSLDTLALQTYLG